MQPALGGTTPPSDKFLTINLSNKSFKNETFTLLEKGLTYVPKPLTTHIPDLITAQNKLIKGLKFLTLERKGPERGPDVEPGDAHNQETKKKKLFTEKSTWEPDLRLLPGHALKTVQDIKTATTKIINKTLKAELPNFSPSTDQIDFINLNIRNKDRDNLSGPEREELKNLKRHPDIIIKPADKGGATVIMEREAYEFEANRQLNNVRFYRHIPKPLAQSNSKYITNVLHNLKAKKFITPAQCKYLSGPSDFSIRRFYLLPKIHKPKEKWTLPTMPEGRPIVSDTNSEGSRISEYIDSFIQPFSTSGFSYIKNTYDFLSKIRDKPFPPGALFVTADVKSLYTNMDIDRILETVKEAFEKNKDKDRPDDEIIDLLNFTLRHNDFTFNNKQYLQTNGTAMGKRYAPALANIYMQKFDSLATTHPSFQPKLYHRFLDDIFFIWIQGTEALKQYEAYLNKLIPGIEITFEFSPTEIPFLDTWLYSNGNIIKSKTYFKSTDTHQLLHVNSYHPKHVSLGILKSQFIRFKRLSSSKEDYISTCKTLFSFLKDRGYTNSAFRKLQNDIWFNWKEKPPQNPASKETGEKLLPIIIPFCKTGRELSASYRQILRKNPNLQDIKIVNAFTKSFNLKQLLVKSLYGKEPKADGSGEGGCVKCPSLRCGVCNKYLKETNTFKSTRTGKSFNIKTKTHCNQTNIIYLITCTRCRVQYVGETGGTVKTRLNCHLYSIRSGKPTIIGQHFNKNNHSLNNLEISIIEYLDKGTMEHRKKTEKQWIKTLKTNYPFGLNYAPVAN